jgi:L-rhamnose mutarotase
MKRLKFVRQFAVCTTITIIIISLYSCKKEVVETEKEIRENKEICDSIHKSVIRVGMVIKIKPEKLEEYLALHADTNSGVRHLLSKYHIRNFSIFMTQLEDSSYYEFGYWEYWGDNYEEDMKKLDLEPENKAWLEMCDPMQIPLEGETSWRRMDRIYSNY